MRKFLALTAIAIALSSAPASAQTASERLAAPGPQHSWMEPLVGEWDVEMKVWSGPSAEPAVLPALTATRELVLGGRYLRETLIGGDGVRVREGTLGLNRLDGRFEFTTVDSFEPGQMVYLGRGDETASEMSLFGESTEAGMMADPTGRRRDLRFEFAIDNQDANVQRIYVRYPGQQEYLFVEQRFTRKK